MKHRRFAALVLVFALLLGLLPTALAATGESTDTYCSATTSGKHSWRDWKTTSEATCTKAGSRSRTCGRCGYTQTEAIKKTGHKWGKWKTTTEATCTRQGQQTRKCSVCGKTDTRKTDKAAHKWGSWKTTKEATCVQNGEQTRKCSVCGKTDTRKTDKAAHSWGKWTTTKEATCTAQGERERACRVCGKKEAEAIQKKPHSWGEWEDIVPATDHSSGTRRRACEVCGAEETEDCDPDGTLRRGDNGDAVRGLQEGLICYGALTGGVDGSFGPGTEKAVKALQAAEGFAEDGVAWPQTQAQLGHRFGDWEATSVLSDFSKGEKQRVCARCGYVEEEETWPEPTYRRGDKGDGVKDLQEKLNAAGYDCGRADGDFGGRTERAVSAIEEAHGMTGDGIAWPGVLKWLTGGATDDGGDDDGDDGDSDAPKPLPDDLATTKHAITSAPSGLDPDAGDAIDSWRSLTVIEQTKDEDAYYDGAEIPVRMRLTIDGYDSYRFVSITLADGDRVSDMDWDIEDLEPGGQYDFTYTMRLDPGKTGWKTRNVTIKLLSLSRETYETETCEVRPPFTNAKVTLVGGNSHVIDAPAFIYLKVDRESLSGFPNETLDIPVKVSTSAADDFTNVKLVCDTDWDGKGLYRSTRNLAGKMDAHENRSFLVDMPVRTVPGEWKGYTVTFHATGFVVNAKGKPELVESLPVTLPLEILNPDAQPGRLKLTYAVHPSRSTWLEGDAFDITLYAENAGETPLNNVRIEYADGYEALEKTLGKLPAFTGSAALEPGEKRSLEMHYRVRPEDAKAKDFNWGFVAKGSVQGTGEPVRSTIIHVRNKVAAAAPKASLTLSASPVVPWDVYPVNQLLYMHLNVRNDSSLAVKGMRIYAVGDNRGQVHEESAPWFDLGHGLKGWLSSNHGGMDLKPGESFTIDMPVVIPDEWPDGVPFRVRWAADADLADGTPARSNVAGADLPVGTPAEPEPEPEPEGKAGALDLQIKQLTECPAPDGLWPDGTEVRFIATAFVVGGETASGLSIIGCDMYESEVPVVNLSTAESYSLSDECGVTLDAAHAIGGSCMIMFTANADIDGDGMFDLESEPIFKLFPMGEASDEPAPELPLETESGADEDDTEEAEIQSASGELSLKVKRLTGPSTPEGDWLIGDKVYFDVSATYTGEDTPAMIEVNVTDGADPYEPFDVLHSPGSKSLAQGWDVTLDKSHVADDAIALSFEGFVYGADSEFVGDYTEPVTFLFDIAPSGTGPDGKFKVATDPATQAKTDMTAVQADEEGAGTEAAEGEPAEAVQPQTAAPAVDATPADDGQSADGFKPADGDLPEDTGEPTDDGNPVDGGQPTDDDQPTDGGTPVDDGIPTDDAQPTDGGIPANDGQPAGDTIPAETPAYTEEIVTIAGPAYGIPATVCLPAGEGPFPAVVMLHGTGSTRDEAGDGYRIAAPVLAEKYGIASIRIDFPGNGDSTADYMQYTYRSAVADAKAAADYIAARPDVNGDAIGVMGWSQGGTDALLACAWEPGTFQSLVTWAGAPDLMGDGLFTDAEYTEAKQNGYFVMHFDWRDSLNVSLEWCDDVANTDVLKEFAAGYAGPVLAIAGTDDTTVDPQWSEKIVASSSHPASHAYFIEGMDHTFNVFSEPDLHSLHKAIDATGAFFRATLR